MSGAAMLGYSFGLQRPLGWLQGRVRPIALAAGFALLLFSRDPGHLLHAEFWAEDGVLWFTDAYNGGWRCLAWPANGYLQTLSRLGALAAQLFPLAWAPTLFALIAFAVQLAPALFLVSDRMSLAWPSRPGRYLFALAYLAMPNAWEVYVNLTNAMWLLAILAFLVIVSRPPAGWPGRLFDTMVLTVSGLSGPFCTLLLPVGVWHWLATRNRDSLWRALVLAACVTLQGCFLLLTMQQDRSPAPLGASIAVFSQILTLQFVVGSSLGQHMMRHVLAASLWDDNIIPIAGAIGAGVLAGLALVRGASLLRRGCLFAALIFAAALTHPMVSYAGPQWPAMVAPGTGGRYYVIPTLAWIGILFTCATDANRALRLAGSLLLLLLVAVAIPGDWHYPKMQHTDFARTARAFAAAGPGTVMRFPIRPAGWAMVLTKHDP